MKNAAPWRGDKHSRFDVELRQAVFCLLASQGRDKSMVWHDTEHVLQAWSMLRKHEARLDCEARFADYLRQLEKLGDMPLFGWMQVAVEDEEGEEEEGQDVEDV